MCRTLQVISMRNGSSAKTTGRKHAFSSTRGSFRLSWHPFFFSPLCAIRTQRASASELRPRDLATPLSSVRPGRAAAL